MTHISCITCPQDLPDMYSHSLRPTALGLGCTYQVNRQITQALDTIITYVMELIQIFTLSAALHHTGNYFLSCSRYVCMIIQNFLAHTKVPTVIPVAAIFMLSREGPSQDTACPVLPQNVLYMSGP